MPVDPRRTTIMSRDGHISLPKDILSQHGRGAGTQLVVEDTTDGVLLRAVPLFTSTRLDDVFGCLAYKGAAKSVPDMDAGIAAGMHRRRSPTS